MADTAPTLTAEDEEQQSAFVRIFLIVLGALVLFTLFCMVVARLLSGGASGVENDPILKADVANRIAPVGSVRTSACLLYTSPSPRDATLSRMPSSA